MEAAATRGCEDSPPERKIYMDYNATTPLEPAVIQAVTEAMQEAWGNPSSSYPAELLDFALSLISLLVKWSFLTWERGE